MSKNVKSIISITLGENSLGDGRARMKLNNEVNHFPVNGIEAFKESFEWIENVINKAFGEDVTNKMIAGFHGTRDLLEFAELTDILDREDLKLNT